MLEVKPRSITINAKIKVDDVEVVEIYKTINADGSYGSTAQTIVDTELYATNMEDCRIDREKFEAQCLEIQDRLIMGTLIDLASLEL